MQDLNGDLPLLRFRPDLNLIVEILEESRILEVRSVILKAFQVLINCQLDHPFKRQASYVSLAVATPSKSAAEVTSLGAPEWVRRLPGRAREFPDLARYLRGKTMGTQKTLVVTVFAMIMETLPNAMKNAVSEAGTFVDLSTARSTCQHELHNARSQSFT